MYINRSNIEATRRSGKHLFTRYNVLILGFATMISSFFVTSCNIQTNIYLEDYDYVWSLLEENYPYYSYIENEGLDMKDIKARYRNEVIKVDDEENFAELLSRMFNELGGVGHLSVVDNNIYNGYKTALNNGGFGNETINAAFSQRLNSKKLAGRYCLEEDKTFEELKEDIYSQIQIQYISKANALYIKIPSFSTDLIERDKDILVKAFADYPETENIIFDITANHGGSDEYWINNLVKPFGGSYEQQSILYFKESNLTEDYLGQETFKETSSLDSVPECVQDLKLDKYIDNGLSINGEPTIQTKNKTIKKWVLISKDTYSAADSFAQFCKDTNWANLVGSSTGGAGGGITPVLEILPNTGLLIRFSIDVVIDDDKLNVIEGTSPNIQCIKNETPIDKCIERISEEYKRLRHIVDEADLYNYADYYDDVEEKLIRFADEYALAI